MEALPHFARRYDPIVIRILSHCYDTRNELTKLGRGPRLIQIHMTLLFIIVGRSR